MTDALRCKAGSTGCNGHGAPTYPTFDSMCNGVFAPVCSPEICNVPRIPLHETLVIGEGILLDTINGQNINFSLLIERTMQVYKGQLYLQSPLFTINLPSHALKFFETDGHLYMSALFYDDMMKRNIFVTIHQDHHLQATQFFIDSTSTITELIHIQGSLVSGTVNIYTDHNVHDH